MPSVIFYGAGHNAREKFNHWIKSGLNPVCFVDSDINKHYTIFENSHRKLNVLPLLEAVSRYPDYELYLTQHAFNLFAVRSFLLGVGIPSERIKYCDDASVTQCVVPHEFGTLYPKLQQIYNALQDDLSKALFFGRVECCLSNKLTGIYRAMVREDYIRWVSKKTTYASQRYELNGLWQLLKENYPIQKNDIYLLAFDDDWNKYNWIVERFISAMPEFGITINGCVMPYANSEIKEFNGIQCLSEIDLINRADENTRIIIGFPGWCLQTKDIIDRFPDYKNILFPIADTALPSYFEDDIFEPTEKEIFVDVGVFDLSNSIDFSKWATKGYKKIYAFEPDTLCYKRSFVRKKEMDISFQNKIELINKALSAENCILKFPAEYSGSGQYENDTMISVEAVSLDSYLNGKPVTFVKMDVEGAEMEVLLGMRETIINHKPKLAVCIYHNHKDLFEVTSFLLHLLPEYKFFIRHYNSNETETVLLCKV